MITNQSTLIFSGNTIAPDSANLPAQQKQAWLNSLERAGLSDAIRQFRLSSSSTADFSSDSSTEKPKDNAASTYKNQAESSQNYSSESSLSAWQHTSISRAGIVDSPVFLREFKPENSGEVTASLGTAVMDNKVLSIFKSAELNRSASPLALNSLQYPAQNISMLATSTGVEVWIRDAGITKFKLAELLRGLRQSMGVLGVSLSRVVLNGQDVSYSQQTEESSPRTKGV